jgi:hypothetical protein
MQHSPCDRGPSPTLRAAAATTLFAAALAGCVAPPAVQAPTTTVDQVDQIQADVLDQLDDIDQRRQDEADLLEQRLDR